MRRQSLAYLSACSLVAILSSALIVSAARGDLWLDEIWSLSFASEADSAAAVVTSLKHDNNHVVNTLYLYFVGAQSNLFLYRLLAVASGIGSVILVGYATNRDWGRLESVLSMLLVGSSYPLLLYFSEARGYAPAILLGLVCYTVLGGDRENRTVWRLAVYWLASALGVLSHGTFVVLLAGFVCWNMTHMIQSGESWPRAVRRLGTTHAPPVVFTAVWYVYFLRVMVIGGGPIQDKWEVAGEIAALTLGLPDAPAYRRIGLAAVVVAVVPGATSLRQRHDSRWAFFPCVILFAPAGLVLASSPTFFYFRYLIVCVPPFLMLVSHLVARTYLACRRPWRWAGLAAVAAVLAGQSHRNYLLLDLGRGGYSAAINHVLEASPDGVVRVGSDHDFRNGIVIDFYSSRAAGRNRIQYVDRAMWHHQPPDWYFIQSTDLSYEPPEDVRLDGVGEYRLTRRFEFSGVSGWSWYLFARKK